LCWQFGFVSFWRKIIGTKAARKMLMKLTPGGNPVKEISSFKKANLVLNSFSTRYFN